jgi:hypothetical protein
MSRGTRDYATASYEDGYFAFTVGEFSKIPANKLNSATEPRIIAALLQGLAEIIRSCTKWMAVNNQSPAAA